jgi:hypothetical protein
MKTLPVSLLLFALVSTGCVLRVRPPGPPPENLPRLVTREEAMDIAFRVASDRGYGAKLDDIDKKKDVWKVELDVYDGEHRGDLDVLVSMTTGAVLEVREKFKDKRHEENEHHGRGKGHDERGRDHDEHGRGHDEHGNGKGKGHDEHDD